MNPHKHSPKPGKSERNTVAEAPPTDQASQQPSEANPALRNLDFDHHASLRERLSLRLREDFRLAIISLFVMVSLLTVLPFSVFRFVSGNWRVALLDLGFLLVLIVGLVIAWRSGRTKGAGNLIAAAAIAGVGAVIVGFDQSPMWVPPALVGSFLLATSWFAAILSAVLILLVVGHDQAVFSGSVERWIFLAASVQVALFSLIFSLRSNQRRESLALLAETDPLTGLGNRRALRHDLTRLVARNRRQNMNLALAMLDLDHFKQVNDEFGHEAGDRVLEDMARILTHSTREHDRGYRLGGEEFVLILQGVDAPALESALDQIQNRMRESLASPGGPVTMSIGATLMSLDDNAHACLQRADQAMYKAKTNGRDRVEIL